MKRSAVAGSSGWAPARSGVGDNQRPYQQSVQQASMHANGAIRRAVIDPPRREAQRYLPFSAAARFSRLRAALRMLLIP